MMMMDVQEMERRREAALAALQDVIDYLGPMTDEAPGIVREPILEIVDRVYKVGKDLKDILFK
jgi:hypothetical protein